MELNSDLLKQAKKGDLSAFEEILLVFEKAIFNYNFKLLGQKQDAEDATQQTFIKLYKSLSGIDEEKKLSPWLYAVATNTAYDILRKRKYKVEVELNEEISENTETETADDPYYEVERQFDTQTIQGHLANLKPIQRSIILLHYYKQFSLEEISDLLKMPIGSVKTHLHRGRKELKKIISPDL